MLRISKLTDYATVILSFLAQNSARIASATAIAKAVNLKTPTVSKLLKILAESSLVKSYRGAGGGYQIGRPADSISLADVVAAIEGQLAMTECCEVSSGCALDSMCGIKDNWQIVNRVILTALKGVTLKDMTQSLRSHKLVLNGIPVISM